MKGKICGACGEELAGAAQTVHCSACRSDYHAHCWEKAAGCLSWGCSAARADDSRESREPLEKCPACREKIASFATSCRYCRIPLTQIDNPGEKVPAALPAKKKSRKDPILTALLNLLFPGAGYMYLGYFQKGLLWFALTLAVWRLARLPGLVVVLSWIIFDSSRLALQVNRNRMPRAGRKK